MNHHRFDATTLKRHLRRLPSRRDVLRGLAGTGLGIGALRLSDAVEAKKKSRRKKRDKKKKKSPQPVVNQYGCLEVGQPCRGDSSLCCAGICEGTAPTKKGKSDTSRCVAHDTGTCQQDGPGICTSASSANISCNNDSSCRCFSTTAGSNVCAHFDRRACASCQRDADCIALGFPAGSACTPFAEGFCAGQCASGMTCVIPCGVKLPPEQM